MSRKKDWHAAGQKAGRAGSFRPPTISWSSVLSDQLFGGGAVRRDARARDQYHQGFAKAQKDRRR